MRLCKHEYDISRSLCPQCSIEAKEAAIERRIAEANRIGQAMGARIGQDLSEERRIAAERYMGERNEAVRALEAEKASRIARTVEPSVAQALRPLYQLAEEWREHDNAGDSYQVADALVMRLDRVTRTVEPRDTEPPRREAMVGKPYPSVKSIPVQGALVSIRAAGLDTVADVIEHAMGHLECYAVTRKAHIKRVEEATPAPGPSSFGEKCQAEVGAWPAWKKNAAEPPVETPEPEPKKPPNPYGLSDGRADIWHSGMMRAWAAWLDHIEGTPAPEPSLPEGVTNTELNIKHGWDADGDGYVTFSGRYAVASGVPHLDVMDGLRAVLSKDATPLDALVAKAREAELRDTGPLMREAVTSGQEAPMQPDSIPKHDGPRCPLCAWEVGCRGSDEWWCHSCERSWETVAVFPLEAERIDWRAHAEALQAQVDSLKASIEGTPAPEPPRLREVVDHVLELLPSLGKGIDGMGGCASVRRYLRSVLSEAAGTPGSTEPTGQHEFARHGGRRGRMEP